MKKKDISYFVTRSCLLTLIVIFISIVVKLLFNHIGIDRENNIPEETTGRVVRTRMDMDWEEKYPFEEEKIDLMDIQKVEEQETTIAIEEKTKKSVLLDYIGIVEKKIRDYSSKELFGYNTMNEMAKSWDTLLKWEITGINEYNPVMELERNYFIAPIAETDDVDELLSSMLEMKAMLEESGTPFLYVQTPYKICREDADVVNIVDFSNENADHILECLEQNQVQCMDLREKLHEEGYIHHDMFFMTDHHWKPETGLWATREIVSELNNEFGINLDIEELERTNFYSEVYESYFLGSQGKKATLAVADPDDISLLYPNTEQHMRMEIPSLGIAAEGDFSIIYDYEQINQKDYYNLSPYAAFIYGDNDLTHLYNFDVKNDTKILVFGDSFDNAVVPFLALCARQVDSVDLRVFDGSVKNYIERNDYDMVIVIWNPSAIQWYENADHKTLYDFR